MTNADGPHFPLYIFGISFIKQKWPAACQIWSKLYETFFGGYSGIYTALVRLPERLLKFFEIRDTLVKSLFSTNFTKIPHSSSGVLKSKQSTWPHAALTGWLFLFILHYFRFEQHCGFFRPDTGSHWARPVQHSVHARVKTYGQTNTRGKKSYNLYLIDNCNFLCPSVSIFLSI